MVYMSRNSRKFIQYLDDQANRHGIGVLRTGMDYYLADMLNMILYPQPLINIVGIQINKIRNPSSRHFNVEYWMPMLSNIINGKSQAKRDIIIDWELTNNINDAASIHSLVTSQYLIVDYSNDDNITLQRICRTANIETVRYAIRVGISNNVREIKYIAAVIDKEIAKKNINIQKINSLAEAARESDKLLGDKSHTYNVLEMAGIQYKWNTARDNSEIEARFNRLLEGRDKYEDKD